ncbi:hypothetical protein PFISCL1PPCAC_10594, partial [Pristionchus fissidentatus]
YFSDFFRYEEIMMDCAVMANPVSTFQSTPSISNGSRDDGNGENDEHIYTNLAEMAEINNRPLPPVPEVNDEVLRVLNGGWQEYQTQAGRSYFHHSETGRSQWNPPRFLRSPAQVQAFIAANREKETEDGEEGEIQPETSPLLLPKAISMERDRRSLKCVPLPHAPILPLPTSMSASFSLPSRSIIADRLVPDRPEPLFEPPSLDAVVAVPLEQAPPTPKSASFDCESRGESSLKTIKCGTMEKTIDPTRKKEWVAAYMYLTSAHLIIYKDEKSAEKHGKHYAAPLGVCDLKGATVGYSAGREKKKRKIIEVLLSTGSCIYLRTASEKETEEWHDSLVLVVKKLPAGSGVGLLDHTSALVRTSSVASRAPMCESIALDPLPNKESVIERLMRFFRNRPSVELLKQKGIYKHEAVFGSTLSQISSQEGGALVPKFLRVATELIEARGLDTDGLYRVSGNLSAIQKIRCSIDQDKYSLLVNETDVHVLSGCLKLFFRELSESIFPPASTKAALSAVKLSGKARLSKLDELIKQLPNENRETLKHLFKHLLRVASHSAQNRMQVHNLAIVFGPTLFSCDEPKTTKKTEKKEKGKIKNDENGRMGGQSNSMLAYNLIMQGQVVEILLNDQNKMESLKGPVTVHP